MELLTLLIIVFVIYWIVKKKKKEKEAPPIASNAAAPAATPTERVGAGGATALTTDTSPQTELERIGQQLIEQMRLKEEKETEGDIDVEINVSSGREAAQENQSGLADRCWVPKGKRVEVQDRAIPGGLIYVGQGLAACDNGWQIERALIDPTLKATKRGLADKLGYWPSYGEADAAQRGIYLDWLAGGATDGSIDQGYLFLYFYGLERRYFYDGSGSEDREAILAEILRLRELFPTYSSFDGYSTRFLETVQLTSASARLYEESPPNPEESTATIAKVALAQAARDGARISADWLLLWAYHMPQLGLRTVGRRCYPELLDLFRRRYRERFDEGLVVPKTRTRLRVEYRAASGEFSVYADVGELCDVDEGSDLIGAVSPTLQSCLEDLEPFCRYLGRNADARGSLEAIALLPDELRRAQLDHIDSPFRTWLEGLLKDRDQAVVGGEELVGAWADEEIQLTKSGRLRKKDAERLVGILQMFGLSMVPDVRVGDQTPGKDSVVVLYRSVPIEGDLSGAYRAAELVITLLATVAHADGDIDDRERERLLLHCQEQTELNSAESTRLSAVCRQLLTDPPTFRGLKELISEHLGPEERRLVADLCLVTAVADGSLEGAEMKTLQKVYGLLGLDEARIHADLHSLRAGGSTSEDRRTENGSSEEAGMAPLDREKIRLKQEQSKAAAALIGQVMAANAVEEETDERDSDSTSSEEEDELARAYPGLDLTHAQLLRELSSREQWPIEEFEELVLSHDLMANGAAEAINEWGFETFDEPLLQIDDVVYVRQETVNKNTTT